ncbi:hypothetical protein PF005_g21575 [Phytophthora fragariae]|uniref:Reverse transcriptase Ty1/copia-type domain-containing protein n=1 Tax=Phytophthora fragariae TaxID=53985 RepID=A0A6A3ZWN8_9STRA|nr:hypothetical protein PF011_g28293 [Phytophthora fragariae]KAE9184692.1 hypothetical protein PF005_g21575 [Phytophthora fragariae]KAE9245973.1 hypothetical protein PF002_g6980 [Phytophthora fragariae]
MRAEDDVGQKVQDQSGLPNSDPVAAEDDDLEEKMPVPIASGDRAVSMTEVAKALSDSGSDEDEEELSDTTESFRRSTRVRRPNPKYQDYEVDLPLSLVIEAVNALMEPQTIDEALSGPDADKWIEALEKEHGDLMRNNTWELVERPKDKKVLTGKWVLVKKRDAQGNVSLRKQ